MHWSPKTILAAVAAAVGAFLVARRLSDPGDPYADSTPVDPYAPFEPATGYDPTPKEGAKLFRKWALSKWGERSGSPENIGRWDKPKEGKPFSEHHEGRAWDLMTKSLEHGQSIVDALLAPEGSEQHALARRAGIMNLIWNKQMWRAYAWAGKPAGSWSPYSGESPHIDHIHFSFSKAGGRGETSLYDQIRADFPTA